MGIVMLSLEDLVKILRRSNPPKLLHPFLIPNDSIEKGYLNYFVEKDKQWEFVLPPYHFGQWFVFDSRSPVPKLPSAIGDWELGFVTNVLYEVVRSRYSDGSEKLLPPSGAVLDSMSKTAAPFYARGEGEWGIATYTFENNNGRITLKRPIPVAHRARGLPLENPSTPLQLWLEDKPTYWVEDSISGGAVLTYHERIMVIKAYIAVMPEGGKIAPDGWIAESTAYCLAMWVDLPQEKRMFKALQPLDPPFDSYGFPVPDKFSPKTLDRRFFAAAQRKAGKVKFFPFLQKARKAAPPNTNSELLSNDRYEKL
jgi:hypothetical protein